MSEGHCSTPEGVSEAVAQWAEDHEVKVRLVKFLKDCALMRVDGGSMQPALLDDMFAIVDLSRHRPKSGQIVVAKVEGRWVIRQYQRSRGTVILSSMSPQGGRTWQLKPEEIEEIYVVIGSIWY